MSCLFDRCQRVTSRSDAERFRLSGGYGGESIIVMFALRWWVNSRSKKLEVHTRYLMFYLILTRIYWKSLNEVLFF